MSDEKRNIPRPPPFKLKKPVREEPVQEEPVREETVQEKPAYETVDSIDELLAQADAIMETSDWENTAPLPQLSEDEPADDTAHPPEPEPTSDELLYIEAAVKTPPPKQDIPETTEVEAEAETETEAATAVEEDFAPSDTPEEEAPQAAAIDTPVDIDIDTDVPEPQTPLVEEAVAFAEEPDVENPPPVKMKFRYENAEDLELSLDGTGSPSPAITVPEKAEAVEPPPPPQIQEAARTVAPVENVILPPIKMKNEVITESKIEMKAGDGARIFFGTADSAIVLNISSSGQEWRLLVNSIEEKDITVEVGDTLKIPQEFDFAEGFLYNEKNGSIINAGSGDVFTFSEKSGGWKLSLLTLKEIPLKNADSINLNGRNGILLGPKATSLVFYNAGLLSINRNKQGDYRPADYSGISLAEDRLKAFIFSAYHENTFFEGDDEIDTICLECEDNSTYGWNVKFENGLFMNISDLIEYQNRNSTLPDDKGVLYHGANRLEFSNVKSIRVYKKPFYYGYGIGGM